MRLLPALMLAAVAAAPVAFAQPQNEPRLDGGPERVCSEDDIRQALAGSYTGPPCRFTDLPGGMDAVPPQRAHRPDLPAVMGSQPAGHAFIASQQGSGRQAETQAETAARQWPPRASGPAMPTNPPAPQTGETVRLDDSFFTGALVGGVERPFMPVYSYRGLVLIAADGQVRTGHDGLVHRVLQVRALDHRAAQEPRRAYPYR